MYVRFNDMIDRFKYDWKHRNDVVASVPVTAPEPVKQNVVEQTPVQVNTEAQPESEPTGSVMSEPNPEPEIEPEPEEESVNTQPEPEFKTESNSEQELWVKTEKGYELTVGQKHNTSDEDFAKAIDENPDAYRYYASWFGNDALLKIRVLDISYNREKALVTLGREHPNVNIYREAEFDLCSVKLDISVIAVENADSFEVKNSMFDVKEYDGSVLGSICFLTDDIFGTINEGDHKIRTMVISIPFDEPEPVTLIFDDKQEFDISKSKAVD